VDGNKQENDTQERETRSTSDENTVRTCSWKAWLSIPRKRGRGRESGSRWGNKRKERKQQDKNQPEEKMAMVSIAHQAAAALRCNASSNSHVSQVLLLFGGFLLPHPSSENLFKRRHQAFWLNL
jgi:hypothetical protein